MLTFFCQITAYILRNTRRVHTQNKLILLTALSTGQLLSYFLNLFFSFEFQQLLQLLTLTNVLNIPVSMNRLTFLAHSLSECDQLEVCRKSTFLLPRRFLQTMPFSSPRKKATLTQTLERIGRGCFFGFLFVVHKKALSQRRKMRSENQS